MYQQPGYEHRGIATCRKANTVHSRLRKREKFGSTDILPEKKIVVVNQREGVSCIDVVAKMSTLVLLRHIQLGQGWKHRHPSPPTALMYLKYVASEKFAFWYLWFLMTNRDQGGNETESRVGRARVTFIRSQSKDSHVKLKLSWAQWNTRSN